MKIQLTIKLDTETATEKQLRALQTLVAQMATENPGPELDSIQAEIEATLASKALHQERRWQAYTGTNGHIITVYAYGQDEAIGKITLQLDREGRRPIFKAWVADGKKVRLLED